MLHCKRKIRPACLVLPFPARTFAESLRKSCRFRFIAELIRKAARCWNLKGDLAFSQHMFRYRFITPHRQGKWYPDLKTAQRFACEIGAGFLERRSGKFFAYRNTKLEVEPSSA